MLRYTFIAWLVFCKDITQLHNMCILYVKFVACNLKVSQCWPIEVFVLLAVVFVYPQCFCSEWTSCIHRTRLLVTIQIHLSCDTAYRFVCFQVCRMNQYLNILFSRRVPWSTKLFNFCRCVSLILSSSYAASPSRWSRSPFGRPVSGMFMDVLGLVSIRWQLNSSGVLSQWG